MPIYEYRCTQCGHEFDTLQKVSEAPLTVCPKCNEHALTKKVSAAGFRLKGGGWYETDFKSGKKRNVAGEPSGDGAGKASGEGAGKSSGEGAGKASGEGAGKASGEGAGKASGDSAGKSSDSGGSSPASGSKGSSGASSDGG